MLEGLVPYSLAGEKRAGLWGVKGHPTPSSHCASESTTVESVTPAPSPCAQGTSSVPPACVVISSGSYTCSTCSSNPSSPCPSM